MTEHITFNGLGSTGTFTPGQVRALLAKSADLLHPQRPLGATTEAGEANARGLMKAEKTPQAAIYDAQGNLVGTVDPAEITMLAAAKPADALDAPPTDLTPAPPASVGTPADAVPAATAKAMSLGAEQRGAHQLGGPNPRGGVPTVPAEDADETEEVTKARVERLAAVLKQSMRDGGASGSAGEAAHIGEAMNHALIAKFEDMQRRGLAPGTPRRR